MSVETNQHVRREPSRRRGFPFSLGLGLLLAGLGILGYVGWQFFGTNIVAHQRQHQAITELRRSWQSGSSVPSSTPGASPDATPGSTPGSTQGVAEALIRIPRFGKDYEMPVANGVGDDVLARGFGHFPTSADPGQEGNYALAAHRITHGEPLRDMPDLRPGDLVVVETRDAVYTYRLDTNPNELIVTFHDGWVVDPLPTNPRNGGVEPTQKPGEKLITLTTCSELFHTDNRMIAFGHLVGTERK